MKIVIDIPEQIYKELTETAIMVTDAYPSTIERALTEGIALPNGHGDLVDLKEMIDAFWDGNSMEIYEEDLEKIKVVVEADKEIDE